MRGMLAHLSPNEERTLRQIGFGPEGKVDALHIRRLLQLELIDWSGWNWCLTVLGRNRYEMLKNFWPNMPVC